MTNSPLLRIKLADALRRLPGPQKETSVSLFEHGSLVVKLCAPAGSDSQTLNTRDEIYVIARGAGEFVYGDHRQPIAVNDVLFAAAGLKHGFENFTDDFAIWIFSFGPEGGEIDLI